MPVDAQLQEHVANIRETARAIRDVVRQDVEGQAHGKVYQSVRPFEDAIGNFFGGAWAEPREKLSVTPYQQVSPGTRIGFSRNAEQPVEIYKQHIGRLRQLYQRDAVFCMRVRADQSRNWLALEFDENVSTVLRSGKLKIMVCGKSNRPTAIEPLLYFNRRDRDNIELAAGVGTLSDLNTRAMFNVSIPQSVVEQKDKIIASKLVLKVLDNANYEFKLFDLRVFGLR